LTIALSPKQSLSPPPSLIFVQLKGFPFDLPEQVPGLQKAMKMLSVLFPFSNALLTRRGIPPSSRHQERGVLSFRRSLSYRSPGSPAEFPPPPSGPLLTTRSLTLKPVPAEPVFLLPTTPLLAGPCSFITPYALLFPGSFKFQFFFIVVSPKILRPLRPVRRSE